LAWREAAPTKQRLPSSAYQAAPTKQPRINLDPYPAEPNDRLRAGGFLILVRVNLGRVNRGPENLVLVNRALLNRDLLNRDRGTWLRQCLDREFLVL